MAYAFSAIDDLLKDNQKENQDSNIFGTASQPLQGNQVQGQPLPKTVAEGTADISSSPTNVNASGGSNDQQDYQTALASKTAYAENAGKTSAPKAIEDTRSQLASNEQALQNKSNEYLNTQKSAQQYSIGNEEIDKAVNTKDAKAWENISGLLGRSTVKPVEEFQTPDVSAADIDNFKTDAGLKYLVSRGMDPGYSKGMAAFDVRALHNTPGFAQTLSQLEQQQEQLQGKADQASSALKGQVEDYGKQQLADAQKSVKDYLGNRSANLTATNEAEAKAYNDALAQLNLKDIGTNVGLSKALTDVKGELGASNPNALRFVDPSSVDVTQFVKRGQNLGAQDFVSADEASQFNNIMGLLGQGGSAWQASLAHPDAASNYTVDQAGLNKALRDQALAGYGKYYDETTGTINDIKTAAQKRADAEDTAYLQLVNDQGTPDWLNTQALLVDQNIDPSLKGFYSQGMIDPNKYLTNVAPIDLNWQDVLSQDEAAKANELARTIGQPDTFQIGSYQRTDPYRFDKSGYMSDLVAALTAKKQAADTAAQQQAQDAANQAAEEQKRKDNEKPAQLSLDYLPGSNYVDQKIQSIAKPVQGLFGNVVSNPGWVNKVLASQPAKNVATYNVQPFLTPLNNNIVNPVVDTIKNIFNSKW